jgi:hypothetical protein
VGEDDPVPTATIPHGKTARRLEWAHLPPHVRALVERHTGSAVESASSRTTGFTPGLASVLTCRDGSRHFVKAASMRAQRAFAQAYLEEARKLAALPATVPAPRLAWQHADEDWVVLGIEHVEAAHPARPWLQQDLDRSLDLLETVADTLPEPPDGLPLDSFATENAEWPSYWRHLRSSRPDLAHADEAASLAARSLEVTGGSAVVHTDVRDDNILLCADGRTLLCDWNWPVTGAAWIDTVLLLIGPRGDGLDVERVLAERRLVRDVPAEHVDALLALVAGYFLRSAELPVPPTSPHVRDAQRWQGEVVWQWLVERRGWSGAHP